MDHHHRTLLTLAASCLDDPFNVVCHSYVYPNATVDLHKVCDAMPSMAACSIQQQCTTGGALGAPCDAFSLLVHACAAMPMMDGCHAATALCPNGTAVDACMDVPGDLKKMPSGTAAQTAARSACAAMPMMPACAQCGTGPGECPNPLLALSRVCGGGMSSMSECTSWLLWCHVPGATHDLPAFCGDVPSGADPVPMRMYFHTGIRDYVLFHSWVPSTLTAYILAIAATALGGVVSAWLRAVRVVYEAHAWARASGGWEHAPLLRRNTGRALIVVISSAVDYLLMLIAMTFNVGLFVAVILGLGVGTLLFGHWGRSSSPDTLPDTHAPFLDGQPARNQPHEDECCH